MKPLSFFFVFPFITESIRIKFGNHSVKFGIRRNLFIKLYKIYCEFINNRGERIQELIQERTSDEDKQEKVHTALLPLIMNH